LNRRLPFTTFVIKKRRKEKKKKKDKGTKAWIPDRTICAGSSGPVHNVVLIYVYLDLETPGGWDFG
jgi:hypothetical protein